MSSWNPRELITVGAATGSQVPVEAGHTVGEGEATAAAQGRGSPVVRRSQHMAAGEE